MWTKAIQSQQELEIINLKGWTTVTFVPLRLSHLYHCDCHTCIMTIVTLVPRLWYCRDNSFGTVVTIGIGIVRLVVFRLTVSICRLSISMPSCQCGISVFALAVSFLWTWSCIPTVTQGSQYLLRQSQCHWKFHKIERKHLLYRHILIYCLLNVHIQ